MHPCCISSSLFLLYLFCIFQLLEDTLSMCFASSKSNTFCISFHVFSILFCFFKSEPLCRMLQIQQVNSVEEWKLYTFKSLIRDKTIVFSFLFVLHLCLWNRISTFPSITFSSISICDITFLIPTSNAANPSFIFYSFVNNVLNIPDSGNSGRLQAHYRGIPKILLAKSLRACLVEFFIFCF